MVKQTPTLCIEPIDYGGRVLKQKNIMHGAYCRAIDMLDTMLESVSSLC